MKRIAVMTANRSERGILQDFCDRYENNGKIELFLKDIDDYIPVGYKQCEYELGEFDGIFILGDRPEMIAPAIYAVEHGIPIFHHHGGDDSNCGKDRDDKIRWAITMMANVHFAASTESYIRIKRVMDNSRRTVFAMPDDSIYHTGSITMDICHEIEPARFNHKVALVLVNPMSGHGDVDFELADEKEVYLIPPNGDPGSELIVRKLKAIEKNHDNVHYGQLERKKFISLLASPEVTCYGNSSSFYIERTFWKKGSKLQAIGDRNSYREADYWSGDKPAGERIIEIMANEMKGK